MLLHPHTQGMERKARSEEADGADRFVLLYSALLCSSVLDSTLLYSTVVFSSLLYSTLL
jgi:hypothetical protein